MILLLLKADQLGLFDKLVPIAGSVSKEGVVTKPHFAVRKVKAPEAKAPEKARKHDESGAERPAAADLFDVAAKPKPQPKPEPKPQPNPKPEPKATKAPKEEPSLRPDDLFARQPKKSAPKAAEPVAPAAAAPIAAQKHIDFSKPFDPSSVPEFGVPAGISKEARRKINADAALLVESKTEFTAEDRALLRQYSGNGGCGDSLNEFYTDPKVAAAIWYVLEGLGLPDGAAVLEPSCATGVFLETAPAAARVTGVELDPTSADIGRVLHPRHEVENASFERFSLRDERQFDAVIGNAPFGLRGSMIKDDKPNLKTAEAYFLDTSIDKTKDGGIVAMIVPTGVMDSKRDRSLRERLLRKAEFLGALRMPNTAFEHSHTGVTTDVLFFRKRPQDVAGALATVKQDTLRKLGVWDDEYLSGGYFTGRGAANVLGTMTEGWRAKAGMGDDITVEGSMIGVPEAIAEFKPETESAASTLTVPVILDAIGDEEGKARALTGALKKPYDHAVTGSTKTVDGVEYVLQGHPPRWHRVDEFLQDEAVTDADALATDIERAMQGDEVPDLANRVRAYVEKHGIPAKNDNLVIAANHDKRLYRLIGAVNADGTLSDVVENRRREPVESSFDAAAQSLALDGNGYFSPEMVAARWHGGDSEVALDHLYASPEYALDPASGLWTSVDNYLSGNLWPKLDEVKAAISGESVKAEDRAKYERQAGLLEEAIDPKSLEDVEVMLNSAFLPLDIVAAFFNEKNAASDSEWQRQSADMKITFDKGIYSITGGTYEKNLLEKYLNRAGVKKDDLPAIERMNQEFKTWLTSSKYRDEVENLYNRKFRGFRQKAYSDKPFEIPGLNTEGLKSYQYSGLRWALEAGKGIIAADVGLGKTVRGLMLARMAKVTGRAKKPMLIVPKSVLANWVAEAEKWFPGSRVLVIGETYTKGKDGKLKAKQDTADERNRKFHDLTQNDYDFILISQPAWNDLDVDPITKGQYANDDFWVQRGDALGNAGDKRLNKIREAHKQALAQREFQKRTDAIYFNDLGVDMIIGDEFHAFKNLYAARNRFGETPKFLGGQGLSNRALDMNFKARWVRDHNDGKNVYGLTATPTKNSPLEIYSMLSHIAPEAFEQIGVRNSEEFLDRFCEFKTENILNTRGEIEEALVTVGFKNLDELRGIMRRYMDRTTAEDVGLVLPKRDDRMHLVDMSVEQKAVYAELREKAEESAKSKDATGDAHIFSIMDKMGKAAMDLELYDPVTYAGADSPKYHAAADQIAEGIKDGGQVVFADNIAVHQKMVEALVKRGVPRDQIAVINAQVAASSAQRQNIADAFNAGKLKVVIGNTATMGEGINLQKGTTDIHHMDLTWEPASIQQRNGRGLRQGNINEAVRIHTYLAKGSFDGYRYQSLLAKKDWQDLLWNGGDRVENLSREGNLSRDDMLIMLSADPEAARAKMVSSKEAAQERFAAMKHSEAAVEFVRFQEMKRSYSGLKKKDTPSAERLRIKIDRLKNLLNDSKWFTAKSALDAKTPVMIHPQTGMAFEAGTAFMVDKSDGDVNGGGKFVVTSVDPAEGSMRIRRYGEVAGRPALFTLDMLKDGVKPFEYDEKAEQAEVAKHLEEAAKSKVGTVTSPKEMHGMPAAVIEASYAPIQQQLKSSLKEYKWNPQYGADVAFLDKEGNPMAADSYAARDLLDSHDLMLPIPAHREKAIAAYIADERAKVFHNEYQTHGRRGQQSTTVFTANYPGKYGAHANRWAGAGDEVFGTGFRAEAHAAFERAQGELARHAKTFTDAIDAVAPMVQVTGGHVSWPKRGLAILWAKAKREGKLDTDLSSLVPETGEPGRTRSKYSTGLFSAGSKYQNTHVNVVTKPVREALITLAEKNRYYDLATAMMVSDAKSPEEVIPKLIRMPGGKHVADAVSNLIAKNPDLADRKVTDFLDRYDRARHTEYRDRTLADMAAGDDDTGDERNAA